jgi:hypothetical protein
MAGLVPAISFVEAQCLQRAHQNAVPSTPSRAKQNAAAVNSFTFDFGAGA